MKRKKLASSLVVFGEILYCVVIILNCTYLYLFRLENSLAVCSVQIFTCISSSVFSFMTCVDCRVYDMLIKFRNTWQSLTPISVWKHFMEPALTGVNDYFWKSFGCSPLTILPIASITNEWIPKEADAFSVIVRLASLDMYYSLATSVCEGISFSRHRRSYALLRLESLWKKVNSMTKVLSYLVFSAREIWLDIWVAT